jgi:hypothetical protein
MTDEQYAVIEASARALDAELPEDLGEWPHGWVIRLHHVVLFRMWKVNCRAAERKGKTPMTFMEYMRDADRRAANQAKRGAWAS